MILDFVDLVPISGHHKNARERNKLMRAVLWTSRTVSRAKKRNIVTSKLEIIRNILLI